MFSKVKTTGGRENYARKRGEDGKLNDKTRKRSFEFFNEIIISSRYESAGGIRRLMMRAWYKNVGGGGAAASGWLCAKLLPAFRRFREKIIFRKKKVSLRQLNIIKISPPQTTAERCRFDEESCRVSC